MPAAFPNTHRPRTRPDLAEDLTGLGVAPGDTLLVHTSLRSLGWVCGADQTVVHALLDAVGPAGTLVVPTQTGDNSDPSGWADPPVPESWWETVRAQTPAFDPATTPSVRMGRVPERIRTWPGAVRSTHPQTSFAALGPHAARLMHPHPLESALGEGSPLARLEEEGARVLLLGAGYDSCTAFHLAEYRVPDPPTEPSSCAVRTPDGAREWVTYTGVALDESDFPALGTAFEVTGAVTTGPVGSATARLFPLAEAVAFATSWLARNRPPRPWDGAHTPHPQHPDGPAA
ncbi:AAC(3) family N-acetyltransferase [Nocardiopsis terrae]|uniref:Aminoglycoside N(3)-acetyltransferase n=1 Tax=Nocardiopsis terrae TaxID=372655 RepID=A0ABR9HEL5_9ACTN|nr:AAC(3) family N-acetyltransferase [Nocardiopsis terrae]MBE1457462.1 aminoglycoside 3-N-acetyltransferase [Nocardiopsis terrae]GHC86010.1 AAC(3) family N-acetyltransferase [Nocardiopsis terrae]